MVTFPPILQMWKLRPRGLSYSPNVTQPILETRLCNRPPQLWALSCVVGDTAPGSSRVGCGLPVQCSSHSAASLSKWREQSQVALSPRDLAPNLRVFQDLWGRRQVWANAAPAPQRPRPSFPLSWAPVSS